ACPKGVLTGRPRPRRAGSVEDRIPFETEIDVVTVGVTRRLLPDGLAASVHDFSVNLTYSVLSPKPGGNQAPKYSGKRNGRIKRVGLNRGAARKLRLWGFESSRAAHRGMFEG